MVPVFVSDDQQVDIRHVFRRVEVRARERFHHQRGRELHLQQRVHQNGPAAYGEEIRGMTEPYEERPCLVYLFQVRIDRF